MQWTVFALLGSARQAEVQALVRLEGISTNKEQLLFHLTERVWVYLVCKGPSSTHRKANKLSKHSQEDSDL